MKKCAFFLFVLLPLLSLPLAADANQLNSTRKDLEREIVTCVDSLIAQSEASTENSLRAMSRYESASSEAEALKMERDDLKSSSEDILKSLSDSKQRIIELLQSLKFWRALAITVSILGIVNLLGKAVTLILKTKGITLPEIINILW